MWLRVPIIRQALGFREATVQDADDLATWLGQDVLPHEHRPEPVLTTPITREEFLLGKALAALVPSVAIAYAVYAVFLACVAIFARPGVASALIRGPDLLAQLLFTPLLAAWSIGVGLGLSARASDIRVAQQLGVLVSLPLVAVTSLIAFNVIHATLGLALGLAAALLLGDGLGWRIMGHLATISLTHTCHGR